MKCGLLLYWEITNGSCTTRMRDVCRLDNELGEPLRNCLIYVPRVKSKTRNINDDNVRRRLLFNLTAKLLRIRNRTQGFHSLSFAYFPETMLKREHLSPYFPSALLSLQPFRRDGLLTQRMFDRFYLNQNHNV